MKHLKKITTKIIKNHKASFRLSTSSKRKKSRHSGKDHSLIRNLVSFSWIPDPRNAKASRGTQVKNDKRSRQGLLIGTFFLIISIPTAIYLARNASDAQALWAPTLNQWEKRKKLEVTNNSSENLATGTTIAVTVNTKELGLAGQLKDNCEDLRVVYHSSTTTAQLLPRHVVTAGDAGCAASEATKVYFSLQSSLNASATDASYYIYYDNSQADAPTDDVDAYDMGSAEALLVCPFNGTTDCINSSGTETPTTESGAVRYSGSEFGSAIDLDRNDDEVRYASTLGTLSAFTFETWIQPKSSFNSTDVNLVFWGSSGNCNGVRTWASGSLFFRPTIGGVCEHLNGGGITKDVWTHVAYVYDGSEIRVYRNGEEYASDPASGTIDFSQFVLGINASPHMMLDEVRLSDIARYSSNFTPSTSPFFPDDNTLLLYHFDENGDDPRNTGKAIDSSGNGNHGSITGAKYVSGLTGVDGTSETGKAAGANSSAGHEGIFIEEGTTNKITNPSFENSSAYNTNWSDPSNEFNLDTASTTFTAAMAKRNGADSGPFAAGVLVQGDTDLTGTADVITYGTGTQINNNFYENIDGEQGTVVFWVTPEWNGTDGESHVLWQAGNANDFRIYKYQNSILYCETPGGGTTVAAVSWTAGTKYLVTCSWDTKASINGSSVRLSVNDSHLYAGSGGSVSTIDTTQNIGSSDANTAQANALIEGLTIYRRPLFDGNYGIDVGNGDEIAAIYNSGTGADPTLTTGSWDVVFALPTNASIGELTTGTGEAWSHPHSSNLLYTDTNNTGGFMMNGTYTSDGWADEGTPSSVSALGASDKIFSGGYSTTSDAADEGIYYSETVTAGDDWVIRALGHSDGTCDPKVILYDQTNGAEIGSLAGTTTSTRTAPDAFIFTGEAPAGMTELRVKLVNTASSGTCYWHQVELLDNLITNPSLESGSGDPWVPTGWNTNLDAGEASQETTIVHTGQSSVSFAVGAGSPAVESMNDGSLGLTAGDFITQGAAVYGDGSSAPFLRGNNLILQHGSGTSIGGGGGASWIDIYGVKRFIGAANDTQVAVQGHSSTIYADDVYTFQLDPVSLTVTPASEANSTENSGVRVDGADSMTQTISGLTSSAGSARFIYTPRHSAADAVSFGNANAYIATLWGDSDDYIKLYWSAANTITLDYSLAGSTGSDTYDATGAIAAGTSYDIMLTYLGGAEMNLYIDGVNQISLTSLPAAFGATPTTAYWGSNYDGSTESSIGDATFANPTFTGSVADTQNSTAPYYKFGSKSAQLVASGDGRYAIAIDPDSTSTHTLSAYVYDASSGNVGGTVDNTVAQLLFQGYPISSTTYTDMGGGWWRLSYSAATADTTSYYGVTVLDGKTVYVDGVQLESKSTYQITPSTFTDGSLGTGYSWSGTEHESTSTRTASDIEYTKTANIDPTQGSLSFWYKPNFNASDVNGSSAVHVFTTGSHRSAWGHTTISINSGSLVFKVVDNSGNVTNSSISGTSSWVKDEWQHIVLSWNESGNTVLGYWNGTQATPGTSNATAFPFGSQLQLGGYDTTIDARGAYSNFSVWNDELSSAQITDLYQSGLVNHKQEYAVDRFSGEGQDPVAIWHLDEGTGTTTNDASKYGNDGTISGATWATEDKCIDDKCLQFDGTDDYVDHTNSSNLEIDNTVTIQGWFKGTNLENEWAVSKWISSSNVDSSYLLVPGYSSTDLVYCFISDGANSNNVASTTTLQENIWYHIACSFEDDGTMNIYINGELDNTKTQSTVTSINTNTDTNLVIGQESSKTNIAPFTGFIDEVKIYPYARSADQIKTDYQKVAGPTGSASVLGAYDQSNLSDGLVGYWQFEEDSYDGTSDEVVDSSGAGNHMIGGYSPYVTTATGKFGKAATFDAAGEVVTLTSGNDSVYNLTTTQSYTFSTWFKATDSTDFQVILEKRYGNKFSAGPGYGIYIDRDAGSSDIKAEIGDGTNTQSISAGASVDVEDDAWHHTALIISPESFSFYLDGVLIGEKARTVGSLSNVANSIPFVLGANATSRYTENFKGNIDDTRVYNRALSQNEVKQLYTWAPGPVAHYKFDENTGTTSVNDSSGNGNTGTINGSMTEDDWVTGKYGSALVFDGSDDYINIADDDILDFSAKAVSYCTWFKTTDSGISQNERLISKGSNGTSYGMVLGFLASNDSIFFGDGPGYVNTTSTFDDGNWHHACGVYDGTTGFSSLAIYVDGVNQSVSSAGTFDGPSVTTEPLTIGAHSISGAISLHFDGSIDDVRVYNYALDEKQITNVINGRDAHIFTAGSALSSKVSHWSFDESQGQTINDKGLGGNNGTRGADSSVSTDDPTWISAESGNCKVGGCLSFDGGDYLFTTTSGLSANQGSVTSWVKRNGSPAGAEFIFSQTYNGNRIYQYIHTSGNYYIRLGDSTAVDTGVSVVDNEWHQLTLTWDSGTYYAYADGKQVSTGSYTNLSSIATYLNIGSYNDFSGGINSFFTGYIDEVKIYNTALTAEEVALDYNQGSSINYGTGAVSEKSLLTDGAGNGPVAHWDFNEGADNTCTGGTNDVCDKSGNANDGALSGGPNWTTVKQAPQHAAGLGGHAVEFDGSDDYIDVSNLANFSSLSTGTFEAWVKADSLPIAGSSLLGFSEGSTTQNLFLINAGSDGSIRVLLRPGSGTTLDMVSSAGVFSANAWYHVAYTTDVNGNSLYVNGIKQSMSYTTGSTATQAFYDIPTGAVYHWLGAQRWSGALQRPLNGTIDEVKIYDYALTQSQVSYEYNRGKPIAHYKFDACQGNTAYDASGFGNNGTITIGATGTNTSAGTCSSGTSTEAWNNGTTGKYSASLDFDGTDDWVTLSDPSDGTLDFGSNQDFSAGAWIKTTDPTFTIVEKGATGTSNSPGYWLFASGGQIDPRLGNPSGSRIVGSGIASVNDDAWHHIMVVFDRDGFMTTYIDGTVDSQINISTLASADQSNSLDFDIGAIGSGSQTLDGQIDDVRIYNYALSASQVKNVYNGGSAVIFGE